VVVPVTAAPAGWCDLMARQWPVQAVIGENGGLSFRLDRASGAMRRDFWLPPEQRAQSMAQLRETADRILAATPDASPASDQPYRQTTWAIEPSGTGGQRAATADQLAAPGAAGARSTINSLWVLGWLGDFDKLAMALQLAATAFSADRDAAIYIGDSLNDEPMFRFFPELGRRRLDRGLSRPAERAAPLGDVGPRRVRLRRGGRSAAGGPVTKGNGAARRWSAVARGHDREYRFCAWGWGSPETAREG
jgi:hypothetical protein